MLYKTRGIVLTHIRYRETSIVVNIFTEAFGLRGYIVNGVRTERVKAAQKIALYQPLTLLDLVVYNREQASLQRIAEVRVERPLTAIALDIRKTTIGLLLTEVISKALHEEKKEEKETFDFLHQSILALECLENGIENFHLIFLIKFAEQLGFAIDSPQGLGDQLLQAGFFFDHLLEAPLQQLLQSHYTSSPHLGRQQRNQLLDALLHYFALHIDGFGQLRSLHVLREL